MHDADLGYRIYRLAAPLQPGESRNVHFRVVQKPNGITAGQAPSNIVDNGTFFNSRVLPSFGYNEGAEISDRNERRKRAWVSPGACPSWKTKPRAPTPTFPTTPTGSISAPRSAPRRTRWRWRRATCRRRPR